MLNNKKLVIFDMDGIIIDSETVYIDIWHEVFLKNNVPIPQEEIETWRGLGWDRIKYIINDYTNDMDATMNLRYEREDIFNYRLANDKVYLKPFALDIIKQLKEEGKYLGLATSTYYKKANHMLSHYDLQKHFDFLAFGDQVENTKPAPDIYLKVFEQFDLEKEDVIIFEDSRSGVLAANNAGIDVIHIPDGNTIDTEGLKIKKIIKDFSEVM